MKIERVLGFKKTTQRRNSGSLIVESAAGTCIFVMVAVGIMMGCINIFALVTNYQKVQMAASAAAQSGNNSRFWLGTYRPDYNQQNAQSNALSAANAVLNCMGLPNCTITQFEPSVAGTAQTGNNGFIVTHVKISVPGLQFPFSQALGFPGVMNISADGYSAAASYTPYATAVIGFTPQGQADQYGRPLAGAITRRIQVPVIGFDSQNSSGGLIQPAQGQCGSAVAGGSYYSCEVRSYGNITNDQMIITNTNTSPNTQTYASF